MWEKERTQKMKNIKWIKQNIKQKMDNINGRRTTERIDRGN